MAGLRIVRAFSIYHFSFVIGLTQSRRNSFRVILCEFVVALPATANESRIDTNHVDKLLASLRLCGSAPLRLCVNQNDAAPETPLSLLRFNRQQNYFGSHAKADWNDARANPCGYEQMVIVFKIVSCEVAIV